MGEIYDQFIKDLARWREKYQDNPQAEFRYLLFLALEREAIVAVAYRDDMLARRIAAMPLPPAIQELIRHALIWAWKDEEMHAIYIRGVIFKRGNFALRIRAFMRQLFGITGGWSGSVLQHLTWKSSPLSVSWATFFTWMGIVTGQVPPDVRKYLQHGSFRDFCNFNIDAEKTARLSYDRLLEVLAALLDTPPQMIEDFRRIREDEERHTRIFEVMAAAIDERDQLVPGETAETLRDKIGAIGDVFLPHSQRHNLTENPTGSGGRVYVIQAQTSSADDKTATFRRLLDDSGLKDQIQWRAKTLEKPITALRIAIKPNFMMGYHRKDGSPITDPELVKALASYFFEQGCRAIAVVEAANVYDRFFQHRSVHEVADYFGFSSPEYQLVDLTDEQIPYQYYRGMAQYSVGKTWRDADFRVSFGKLASHPTDMVHLAISNLTGLGARCDEYIFSERQAHRDTAIMMLLNDFPVHFALLDGYLAPDGLLGLMGAPHPKTPKRFYAGVDPLAVDIVAARHIGISSPYRADILRTACYWFGDPSAQIDVVGIDEPVAGWRDPYHTEWSTFLSLLAYPIYEFGSGRGALFVAEMDEQAFPSIRREHFLLRAARKGVQILLGLHHW